MQATETRFLTARQSAVRIGVTANAIKSWIRGAELPAIRTPGGHHRIAEADLLAFKARLTVVPGKVVRETPRILLVDDEEPMLSTLRDTVEVTVPDATVEVATDGYEALIQVGRFHPHLLVLDLRMPRLDGFEVCHRLRTGPATRSTRILAMSGYADDGTRGRILQCGADDFLEKPFDISEFRAKVVALLGHPGEPVMG